MALGDVIVEEMAWRTLAGDEDCRRLGETAIIEGQVERLLHLTVQFGFGWPQICVLQDAAGLKLAGLADVWIGLFREHPEPLIRSRAEAIYASLATIGGRHRSLVEAAYYVDRTPTAGGFAERPQLADAEVDGPPENPNPLAHLIYVRDAGAIASRQLDEFYRELRTWRGTGDSA